MNIEFGKLKRHIGMGAKSETFAQQLVLMTPPL
jgi:hypothetical protein